MFFIVSGTVFGIVLFYHKLFKNSKYWPNRNVPHKEASIIGNMKDFVFLKKHKTDVLTEIYREHPNDRYVGYMEYTKPILMIRDIELIKRVTIKESDTFQQPSVYKNVKYDPVLSKSLINLNGGQWRLMRNILEPFFTANSMKNLYGLINECSEDYTRYHQGHGQLEVDMKDISRRFANDVIATTVFGIKIDSLNNPKNYFFKNSTSFVTFGFFDTLKLFFIELAPKLATFLKIRLFPDEVLDIFINLFKTEFRKREKGLVRRDIIQLFFEIRKNNSGGLTEEDVIAQIFFFFFEGLETVSSCCCFMGHELSLHLDVQTKLQEEIDRVYKKYHGRVPYEALVSMKYLDQVVCETLRLWPPTTQIDRICSKNYKIESKSPTEMPLLVEKNVSVVIPIMALHRDPKYFPEPKRFNPERFNDQNRSKIIPGSYLPFGIGPKSCIGSRFALLEIKTYFFHLLSKFSLVPNRKMENQLRLRAGNAVFTPENGFLMSFKPRYV